LGEGKEKGRGKGLFFGGGGYHYYHYYYYYYYDSDALIALIIHSPKEVKGRSQS